MPVEPLLCPRLGLTCSRVPSRAFTSLLTAATPVASLRSRRPPEAAQQEAGLGAGGWPGCCRRCRYGRVASQVTGTAAELMEIVALPTSPSVR